MNYKEPSYFYAIPTEKVGNHMVKLGFSNPRCMIPNGTKPALVLRCERCGSMWPYGSHKTVEKIICNGVCK